jgi:hypothetical protein
MIMEGVKVFSAKCFVVAGRNVGDKDNRGLNFLLTEWQLPGKLVHIFT